MPIDCVSVVAFYEKIRYNCDTMPKVDPDPDLLRALEAIVESAGGNEAEAARRLGTSRLKINRIRKAKGGATPATRNELWKMLERLGRGRHDATSTETSDTETIHVVRDIPVVALHVLRYMTGIIERDIGSDAPPHAR